MIEEKQVYVTMGKTFDSLEKAKAHRYDLVGQFIDPAMEAWTQGDKIKLVDYITTNRIRLRDLLTY